MLLLVLYATATDNKKLFMYSYKKAKIDLKGI